MAKQKLVWLGKGVFIRGGKVYHNGAVMPDGIDAKELESLKAKGKIGNPVKAVDFSETTALVEAQKKRIKDLESELAEKSGIISTMTDQISERDETISGLEKTSKSKAGKPNAS